MFTGLWAFYNSRTRPRVNRVLYGTSWRMMYLTWWLIVCVSCDEQLVQFTNEWQPVFWPTVASMGMKLHLSIFENQL